jgi:Flp pilus assembly protein TadG
MLGPRSTDSSNTSRAARRGLASGFARDERGATAMIFAVSVIPLFVASGVAFDLAHLNQRRSDLQQSMDFVALSLAKDLQGNPNATPTSTTASRYLLAVNRDLSAAMAAGYPTYNSTTGEICVKAQTVVATAIMSVVGVATMPTSASSCANVAAGTYEVALVLDNTGSMSSSVPGGTKLSALQAAATNFVNFMFNSPALGPRTKMAIVPFAASVNIGSTYATAAFMDTNGASPAHWVSPAFTPDATVATTRFGLFNYLKTLRASWAWGGCVESLTYPKNVNVGSVSSLDPSSLFVPLLSPDEPDATYVTTYYDSRGRLRTQTVNNPYSYTNTYIDDNGTCTGGNPTGSTSADETTKQSRLCKYKTPSFDQTSTSFGPNQLCTTQSLVRMQTTTSSLLSKINAMAANGWTNIHEGFMWGWRTIAPDGPFAEGRAYSDTTNIKVIVLMTDGENTWTDAANTIDKSSYSAYGYYSNANLRLPATNRNVTTEPQARAAMDQLTLEACTNARAQGVVIYAVGFSGTYDPIDQQGRDLLSACAGRSDRTFFTNTADGLQSAFVEIGNQIGKLRLTK